MNNIFQSALSHFGHLTRRFLGKKFSGIFSAGVLAWMAVFSVPSEAQTLINRGNICWQDRANYDKVIVHFQPNGNSDWDSNMTVNGVTIASTGHGSSYAGQSGYVDGASVTLGSVKVGGCSSFFCAPYRPYIDFNQCNPTFEDAAVSPIEGYFWLEGFSYVRSTLSVSKSATPYNLKAGAVGQYYTISVSISSAATTSPTYIYDTLPAGITTSGAITASGGYLYGCPGAGASSLNGCYLPAGSSGTININVPISVANSTGSSVTNTAYVYNPDSANCTNPYSCPGSTTNPVTPNNPSITLSKSLGGAGRAVAGDQFALAIKTGGVNGNTVANVTTSGTGSAVSGVAALNPAVAGTVYTLTETGAAGTRLSQYTSTLTCTDSAGLQTGLPNGQTYDPLVGAAITPVQGAQIACTLTNIPKAPRVRLTKLLGGARISDSDQFVLQILRESDAQTVGSTTTMGSGTALSNSTTSVTAAIGQRYSVVEAMAPGSASKLVQYKDAKLSCQNALSVANGGTDVSALGGAVGGVGVWFGPLVAGDDIACELTNTAQAPSLSLSKALGAGGRVNAADQFDLLIKTGGIGGATAASTTTSGTGSSATGSATVGTAVAGTSYTLTEAGASGASLARYSSTLSCTDSAGVQTGLPSGAVFDPAVGATVTPVAGAAISCTITNTPKAPTVQVTKVLGGARINNADQFVVPIIDQVGGYVAQTTTTGTGSAVGNAVVSHTGQIGARYMIGELMAAGSVSQQSQYNYALTCTNALSTANGGTDVSVAGLGYFLGPPANPQGLVAGDAISCTLTNTPLAPSLQVIQTLSPGIHLYPVRVGYSANNGWSTVQLSSSSNDAVSSPVQTLTAAGVPMQFSLTMPRTAWVIQSVSCVDTNAAVSGNPSTTFGLVTGNTTFSIDAAYVRPGAKLRCTTMLFAPPPY